MGRIIMSNQLNRMNVAGLVFTHSRDTYNKGFWVCKLDDDEEGEATSIELSVHFETGSWSAHLQYETAEGGIGTVLSAGPLASAASAASRLLSRLAKMETRVIKAIDAIEEGGSVVLRRRLEAEGGSE